MFKWLQIYPRHWKINEIHDVLFQTIHYVGSAKALRLIGIFNGMKIIKFVQQTNTQ